MMLMRLLPSASARPAASPPRPLGAAEGKAKGASDAEALMKASRPRVRLNTRQRAALKQWIALREGTGKLE